MMRVLWFDPRTEQVVESEASSADEVLAVLEMTSEFTSGRGRPAVEVIRDDDASLAVAGDGERAYVSWIDSLGGSYHSVGGSFVETLVFDYLGSWSEAAGEHLVSPKQAADCVRAFVATGYPATEAVLFSPD